MKVNLKNILGMAALGMTLLSNTVPTWAGSVGHAGVNIIQYSSTEIHVSGSMVGARYSADSRQYIGCSLDSTPRVMCAARDSADNSVYCYSSDAGHVDAVQKMTDSSYLEFRYNLTNLTCEMMWITNNSSGLQ